jgi:hypothetical protein
MRSACRRGRRIGFGSHQDEAIKIEHVTQSQRSSIPIYAAYREGNRCDGKCTGDVLVIMGQFCARGAGASHFLRQERKPEGKWHTDW